MAKPHFAHSFTVILVLITHHATSSAKSSMESDKVLLDNLLGLSRHSVMNCAATNSCLDASII